MSEEKQRQSTSLGLNRLEPGLASRLAAARSGDHLEFDRLTEPHRRELQVHCYRLLGSLYEAEDLVQETMLRAWRRLDTFEGRASFRAWLYKIATNACLDVLDQRRRRSLPMSTHPAADPHQPLDPPMSDSAWLEPLPDDLIAAAADNPEARYALRESVTLAFLAALQTLPPRQRAVLILRDVLDWRASEAADCLGLTVSAVNSALHRARVTLTKHYHGQECEILFPLGETRWRALLDRYVRAWEAADVEELVSLLKEDAALAMPPTPSWYHGRGAIRLILLAIPFAEATPGRWRLLTTGANSQPALALYQKDEVDGAIYQGVGLQVLTIDGDWVSAVTVFMNPDLLPRFGLPMFLSSF